MQEEGLGHEVIRGTQRGPEGKGKTIVDFLVLVVLPDGSSCRNVPSQYHMEQK